MVSGCVVLFCLQSLQATAPVVQPPAFPAVLSATARTAEQVATEVEKQLQLFPQALVQVRGPHQMLMMRSCFFVNSPASARLPSLKATAAQGRLSRCSPQHVLLLSTL